MTRLLRHLGPAALLCLPLAAAAETPMTADAFEAHTAGRTLTFEADGIPYGIERYMAGRRVLWSFLDGQCAMGRWYPDGAAICFVYDTAPEEPQCWLVYLEDGRLRTVLTRDPEGPPLYQARDATEEMICENFGT